VGVLVVLVEGERSRAPPAASGRSRRRR
jgi:hypothetical protein